MTEAKPAAVRLLLVDDEEDLVTFLAHRLRKRGVEVAVALNGQQALAAAAGQTFDVAVVDLKMPDLDGITVMERLKKNQPFLEVLMLTGHGSHDSAWEAGRLHAFRYLLKPYDFDELHGLIEQAAAQRRQKLSAEFATRLADLMAGTTSARDLIEECDRLRREYEQD